MLAFRAYIYTYVRETRCVCAQACRKTPVMKSIDPAHAVFACAKRSEPPCRAGVMHCSQTSICLTYVPKALEVCVCYGTVVYGAHVPLYLFVRPGVIGILICVCYGTVVYGAHVPLHLFVRPGVIGILTGSDSVATQTKK